MSAEPVVRLVGAGPGDPDLLTLDAEAAVARARTVVADRSLAGLLAAVDAPSEPVLVDDDASAVGELLAAVAGGPGVVRLYVGDPWFHPAGDAERAALRSVGEAFDLVPGVVAELALLAAAGIPAQVRTLAVTTTFAVDHPSAPADPTVAVPADAAHALVVRTTDLATTARSLAERAQLDGIEPDRAAAAVPSTDPSQAVRATLGALAEAVPAGPGVVVVGLVAALDVRIPVPAAVGVPT